MENKKAEFQKELKEEARETAREFGERLDKGRDYLMQVRKEDLTVEDALEAFGFERNGDDRY